ncbi:biopolymer transporter ExbD [Alcanivorax sp. 1008]|uniref:ExbD/TolR family protein n=1 Tax=Alcanivorax sp. 1008 TaxID=2816853 RepID=UPI001DAE238B|nr:biopolymer transporter ExbD [Alcanivorax sp. 1008]MCC1496664.1 biopolymer transporter ExbD [Alcanivorax sp. 1008]
MRLDLPARKPTSIGLTPLIDVVFILLLFFMLATRFIDLTRQPLSVAVAGEERLAQDNVLLIRVLGNDAIELNGTPMNLSQARQQLQSRRAQPVYVDSTGEASLQDVLRATDMLQQAGQHQVHLELLP